MSIATDIGLCQICDASDSRCYDCTEYEDDCTCGFCPDCHRHEDDDDYGRDPDCDTCFRDPTPETQWEVTTPPEVYL